MQNWGSWAAISGSDAILSSNGSHCVYSATMNLSGSGGISALNLNTTIAMTALAGVTSKSFTLTCYLYASDPTSGGSTSVPSGYLYSSTITRTITTNGLNVSFPFSNMNITSGTVLYFWITSNYSIQDGSYIEVYHGNTPSISGVSYIPLNITLGVSPNSVTTSSSGSTVNLTIGNGSGYTLYADFYYGSNSTPFDSVRVYNGTNAVPCPKDWFDDIGVTTLRAVTITVKIRGGPSTPQGSFTLNAGDDMKPDVGTPTAAIVQGESARTYFPNTYISGISKAKISVTAAAVTNAAIASVVLSYPGGRNVTMTYSSSTEKYEGTTGALTGNTEITITVTDLRGMVTQKTITISNVAAYTEPSFVVNTAYRCDSSGNEESGGAYWRIRVTATYTTSLSGNALQKLTAGIKNGTANNLISGTTSAPLSGMTNPKTAYTVVITIQDRVSGEITREITLEGLTRNVVVTRSGSGTYMGVGTTPSRDSGGSAVELPENGSFLISGKEYGAFAALVDGTNITEYVGNGNESFGNDFLNIDLTDRYALKNAAATFSSWGGACANGPNAVSSNIFGGLRLVFIMASNAAAVILIEVSPTPGRVWINTYVSEWKGWKYFYTIGDTQ